MGGLKSKFRLNKVGKAHPTIGISKVKSTPKLRN